MAAFVDETPFKALIASQPIPAAKGVMAPLYAPKAASVLPPIAVLPADNIFTAILHARSSSASVSGVNFPSHSSDSLLSSHSTLITLLKYVIKSRTGPYSDRSFCFPKSFKTSLAVFLEIEMRSASSVEI